MKLIQSTSLFPTARHWVMMFSLKLVKRLCAPPKFSFLHPFVLVARSNLLVLTRRPLSPLPISQTGRGAQRQVLQKNILRIVILPANTLCGLHETTLILLPIILDFLTRYFNSGFNTSRPHVSGFFLFCKLWFVEII